MCGGSWQLHTSLAILGCKRTCGQSLFCQTSLWAKVLLPAKSCNFSHTWLVWPGPITVCLSGSSVWQTLNQSGPLQEPWSCATCHMLHSNMFLAGLPLWQEICMLCEHVVVDGSYTYSPALSKQSRTQFWSFPMRDNSDTCHPEGKLSASLKRLCDYFECCSSAPLLSEHQGENDTRSLCFFAAAGFWCVFVISLFPCLCVCVRACAKWISYWAGCWSLVWQKLMASDRQMFLFR